MEGCDTYYRFSREMFNIDKDLEYFFMVCDGNGMINAGIHDKDLLLFKKTILF